MIIITECSEVIHYFARQRLILLSVILLFWKYNLMSFIQRQHEMHPNVCLLFSCLFSIWIFKQTLYSSTSLCLVIWTSNPKVLSKSSQQYLTCLSCLSSKKNNWGQSKASRSVFTKHVALAILWVASRSVWSVISAKQTAQNQQNKLCFPILNKHSIDLCYWTTVCVCPSLHCEMHQSTQTAELLLLFITKLTFHKLAAEIVVCCKKENIFSHFFKS